MFAGGVKFVASKAAAIDVTSFFSKLNRQSYLYPIPSITQLKQATLFERSFTC